MKNDSGHYVLSGMGDHVADFVAVVNRAIEGLARNTPHMRAKVYDKARGAVRRQLENMKPAPSEDMILRQMGKLDAAIDEVEARYAVSLSADQGQEALLSEEPPVVPRQQPGMYFAVRPSGLVGISSISAATDEDLRAIGAMRNVLREAVDDLIALTSGSNAYFQIDRIARRYRSALYDENGDLVVDLLYGQGVRLENAAAHLRSAATNNNYPEMDRDVAEALNSVIGIHGPTIMCTELGRHLVSRAREYDIENEDDEVYRARALDLWRDVRNSKPVIEPDDVEELIGVNADINEGPYPRHSASLAHATNANVLACLARVAVVGTTTIIAAKAVEDTQLVAATAGEMTKLIDRAVAFFATHKDGLAALSAVSGGDLMWLQAFLQWMELHRK